MSSVITIDEAAKILSSVASYVYNFQFALREQRGVNLDLALADKLGQLFDTLPVRFSGSTIPAAPDEKSYLDEEIALTGVWQSSHQVKWTASGMLWHNIDSQFVEDWPPPLVYGLTLLNRAKLPQNDHVPRRLTWERKRL